MKKISKPVRRCNKCPLNLGDSCWFYDSPKEEWQQKRPCRGFGNKDLINRYINWRESANIMTGREIRRSRFGKRSLSRASGAALKRKERAKWKS